jgi:hypothetical protein
MDMSLNKINASNPTAWKLAVVEGPESISSSQTRHGIRKRFAKTQEEERRVYAWPPVLHLLPFKK